MKIAEFSLKEMEKAIAISHERSKAYKIDPLMKRAPESSRLSSEALRERIETQRIVFDIAKEQIDALCVLLKDAGFCVVLADKDGYILYINGDDDIYRHFEKRNCMPGYRWREQDVGTSAIAITLVEKKPFFVPGGKMYARHAQSISNVAAPIMNAKQEVLGVICISGYTKRMHMHTLGLACQAVETVRVKLIKNQYVRELDINNRYMRALLEAGTSGIVTVDHKGRIVHTNKRACSLLSLPKSHRGKFFLDIVSTDAFLEKKISTGKSFPIRELKTSKGLCFVSSAAVILEDGENVGAILRFVKKKEMVQLAMEIAGSEASFTFHSIVGKSKALASALSIAKIAAKNDAPILILGETGTGKELFAQAIHNASSRRHKPFLTLNCGAIPKELLESELFGYEEGAFTGALKGGRVGKFELADTGTIFLDEIGDMPFDMQVKLLRVLQSGEIQRVGSAKTTKVNMRIISATNKNLEEEVRLGRFREDLFYRISTLLLTVPPLRERKSDIPLFIQIFMRRHGYTNIEEQLCAKAKNMLMDYAWPGNVRQLENTVERAIHLAEGNMLLKEHFGLIEKTTHTKDILSPLLSLESLEKEAIQRTLQHVDGNLSQCAHILGISRPTLYRKIEKYAVQL